MLPCVCSVIDHRGRQNVVRTAVTHSAAPRVPLFCSYHIGFDVICDLLLNKRKATWNLFFKWMHTDDTMNPLKCTSVQAFNGFGKTKI